MIALYPGSFDPPTVGHLDIIRRASRMYERLIVAVLHHPTKAGAFSADERVALLEAITRDLPNVEVAAFEGLTVEAARQAGATVLVRGLRGESDFPGEFALAEVNRHIAPEVETVFLMGQAGHSAVSSSAVREMAAYGCDLTGFVPEEIQQAVLAKFQPGDR